METRTSSTELAADKARRIAWVHRHRNLVVRRELRKAVNEAVRVLEPATAYCQAGLRLDRWHPGDNVENALAWQGGVDLDDLISWKDIGDLDLIHSAPYANAGGVQVVPLHAWLDLYCYRFVSFGDSQVELLGNVHVEIVTGRWPAPAGRDSRGCEVARRQVESGYTTARAWRPALTVFGSAAPWHTWSRYHEPGRDLALVGEL